MSIGWYFLVDHEVVGPFDVMDDLIQTSWRSRRHLQESSGEDPWRVARTELGDGRYVSTVFLSLDHQYFPDGPPLVFETMIFPDCEDALRCSTWDEAVAQHAAVVADQTSIR